MLGWISVSSTTTSPLPAAATTAEYVLPLFYCGAPYSTILLWCFIYFILSVIVNIAMFIMCRHIEYIVSPVLWITSLESRPVIHRSHRIFPEGQLPTEFDDYGVAQRTLSTRQHEFLIGDLNGGRFLGHRGNHPGDLAEATQ